MKQSVTILFAVFNLHALLFTGSMCAQEGQSKTITFSPEIVREKLSEPQKGLEFFDFDINNPPRLGSAIKSVDGAMVNKTILDLRAGEVTREIVGPYVSYNLSIIRNQDDLLKETSGSIKVSAKGFLGSASASSSFTNKTKYNLLHTYLLAKVSIITAIEEISDPKVSATNRLSVDYPVGKTFSAYEFYRDYGNRFIKQRILGGELYVLLDVTHSSLEEKKTFEFSFNASAWVVTSEGKLSSSLQTLTARDKTTMQILAKGPIAFLPNASLESILDMISKFPEKVLAQQQPAVIRVASAPYIPEEAKYFPEYLALRNIGGHDMLSRMLKLRLELELLDNLALKALRQPEKINFSPQTNLRDLRSSCSEKIKMLTQVARVISDQVTSDPVGFNETEPIAKSNKIISSIEEFLFDLKKTITIMEGHEWKTVVEFPPGKENWSTRKGDDEFDTDEGDKTELNIFSQFRYDRREKVVRLEVTTEIRELQGDHTVLRSSQIVSEPSPAEPGLIGDIEMSKLFTGGVRKVNFMISEEKHPAFTTVSAVIDSDEDDDRPFVSVKLGMDYIFWTFHPLSEYFEEFFDQT